MVITNSFFRYAGVQSSTYNLKLLNLNTSSYDSCVGDVEPISFYSKKEAKRTLIDYDYENSPVEFEVDIIGVSNIPQDKIRKIEKWLFCQRGYAKLYFDNDESTREIIGGETKRLYLNCRFKNPSKIEFGKVVGWSCTLECDSCMAWQESITSNFILPGSSTGDSIIEVNVDTDINDYVHPVVKITTGDEGGDITIVNHTDDTSRLTSFSGLISNGTFSINSSINYVSNSGYRKFVNRNFIRLLDGVNSISVLGDVVNISFQWQNMRYL